MSHTLSRFRDEFAFLSFLYLPNLSLRLEMTEVEVEVEVKIASFSFVSTDCTLRFLEIWDDLTDLPIDFEDLQELREVSTLSSLFMFLFTSKIFSGNLKDFSMSENFKTSYNISVFWFYVLMTFKSNFDYCTFFNILF